jgi:hypothetical protein
MSRIRVQTTMNGYMTLIKTREKFFDKKKPKS